MMLQVFFLNITFIVFGRCFGFCSQHLDPWAAHELDAAVFQRTSVESEAKELQFKSFFFVTANLWLPAFFCDQHWLKLKLLPILLCIPAQTLRTEAAREQAEAEASEDCKKKMGEEGCCLGLPTTQ